MVVKTRLNNDLVKAVSNHQLISSLSLNSDRCSNPVIKLSLSEYILLKSEVEIPLTSLASNDRLGSLLVGWLGNKCVNSIFTGQEYMLTFEVTHPKPFFNFLHFLVVVVPILLPRILCVVQIPLSKQQLGPSLLISGLFSVGVVLCVTFLLTFGPRVVPSQPSDPRVVTP